MDKEDKNELFYSRHTIMGYNAFLNFILSGRGNGKTFDFKRMALDYEHQTMWVRRYENDLPDVETSFMADLYKEGYYAEDSISIKQDRLVRNGEVKVVFQALSTSNKKKSVSYADVDYIVFDEFIETKANRNYIPKEVELFLDLIETVNRLRIDRPEVRVFLLANKVSFVNPYFTFFNIKPFTGRFKKYKDGLIVVENYYNEEFVKLKKESRFGRLIEGTKYGKYAIENEAFRDTNDFLCKKPDDSRHLCNIEYENITIGLWKSGDFLYASKAHNPNSLTFAPRETIKEGQYVLMSNEMPVKLMRDLNTIGQFYFEDNIVKDICYRIMMESYR